ncbi:MAG TPA: replicative DNA helicase [Candidatus Sulfotelmatobacter sp.]|nr:replicative DNA helicase [Candidatus Sulfotelmatobacter sp.]
MTDVLPALRETVEGPTPPQALDAERAVLAALLLDSEHTGLTIEKLPANAFYRTAHQKIYDAIVALYNRNEKADVITLAEELRKRGDLDAVGGPPALAQLLEYATATANIEHHVRLIQGKSVLRGLIRAATEIQQECFTGGDETGSILDRAEQRIFAITDTQVRQGFVAIRDLISPTFKKIDELSRRQVRVTGVPSGFEDLDEKTAGFQRGDLIIIAGRPAMGKSSLAVNIAENAAIQHQIPVAVFSLEMSSDQLAMRMLCSQGEVDLSKVRSGFLGREDYPALQTAAGKLYQAPIMLDDSAALNVFEIRAKCRRLKSEGKLGLVVIDYLQLIRATGRVENRVQEISQITRNLKALAKELDIPIIALSQLSRAVEQRHGADKRPQLSDLRESGSVEQDADLVIFVFREEYYKPDDPALKGLAEIIIGKQRNGPTGSIKLTFKRECTRFLPYTPLAPAEFGPSF